MKFERMILDPAKPDITLDCYIADAVDWYRRAAMLVIPGGAYVCHCSNREGEPIALSFLPYGYNAFVLHYSVDRADGPAGLRSDSPRAGFSRVGSGSFGSIPTWLRRSAGITVRTAPTG